MFLPTVSQTVSRRAENCLYGRKELGADLAQFVLSPKANELAALLGKDNESYTGSC